MRASWILIIRAEWTCFSGVELPGRRLSGPDKDAWPLAVVGVGRVWQTAAHDDDYRRAAAEFGAQMAVAEARHCRGGKRG